MEISAENAQDVTWNVPPQPSFRVFKPPARNTANLQPLPDSFFTPTAADLKAAQATLSARSQALVNAPLQLRTTREAEERAKRDRWPNTTIRIKFSDRTQLEKSFPSTDKIRSVYAFVRGSLREDVQTIKFILSQSPPKRDLKVSDPDVKNLSLSELQLAPSSVLLLRFQDESLNGSDYPAPLAESVLSQAVDLPSPPVFADSTANTSSTSTSKSAISSGVGPKNLPKWFKMGQKK
jgi:tether containing UBX domain for GLUT4